MKLIIDIPEMAYEAYKEWRKNKVATVEQSIIANGKPYEERPQGDLISRSYLHTAIGKRVTERHGYFALRDIKDAIDNAPTVEYPFYQEAYQTGYEEGYAQGYIDGSTGADWEGGAE